MRNTVYIINNGTINFTVYKTILIGPDVINFNYNWLASAIFEELAMKVSDEFRPSIEFTFFSY